MNEFVFKQIGIAHSEHIVAEETPIQPVFSPECAGKIEVFKEFEEGLKDIENFSHIMVFYIFDRCPDRKLLVKPFMDNVERGVFATRHPARPNPFGISILSLKGREGNILNVSNIDILDKSPVIDIKPFVPRFDIPDNISGGWTEAVGDTEAWSRGRRGYRGNK